MAIKLKFISTLILSVLLFITYLTFFTPEIKPVNISHPISLEKLLQK